MITPKRPAPPPPVQDGVKLKLYFSRVDKDGNGCISAQELRDALTNGTEETPFSLSTVHHMMDAFNRGDREGIRFAEFGPLYAYVLDWQRCFRRFDKDKSGAISQEELASALTSFGYSINKQLLQLMIQRFDRRKCGEILFDDFIRCCLILHELTEKFKGKDVNLNGKIDLTYQDFLMMIFDCATLFC